MPAYRAYFTTAEAAHEAATATIERLQAKLLAETTEAGATEPTSSPTTTTTVESVADLPAGAISDDAEKHVTVTWKVATSGGHVERHISVMPEDQAPQPVPPSAVVTITASASAKLKAKATLPAQAQITTVGAISISQYTQLEDRATGKKYRSTPNPYAETNAGVYLLNVEESDANEAGEVTHGTQLVFTRPPTNVLPHAYVAVLKSANIPSGNTLTDAATGKAYETTASGNLPGTTEALSGDDVVEIAFKGATPGADAVAVDTELEFDTPISGVSLVATVSVSPTATLPSGSKMTRNSKSYTTSADATIGDAGEASVSIVADEADAASALAVANTLTITSPPSGISATATVTEQSPFLPFPQPYAKQVLGPAIEWRSRVRRVPDGRYRLDVYTYPPGT